MRILVANPPAGIYEGDVNIGQAAYHVWLDFYIRSIDPSQHNVIAHRYSLNAFGKRAEKLPGNKTPPEKGKHALHHYLNTAKTRDKLNLVFEGHHIDDDSTVCAVAEHALHELGEKGYLVKDKNGDDLYLDVPSIAKKKDLRSAADAITFFPSRLKKEFLRLIENNTQEPIAVTRATVYAPPARSVKNNIGPLFVLANGWEAYAPENVVLPLSNNVLAKYGFLRFITRMALGGEPGIDIVYAYPRLEASKKLTQNWPNQINDEIAADMFRYACAKAHSLETQRGVLRDEHVIGGRNLVYLIANMRKVFPEETEKNIRSKVSLDHTPFASFAYTQSVERLESKARTLSGTIRNMKTAGTFEQKKQQLKKEYLDVLALSEVFFPQTASLCYSHLGVVHE